MDFEPLINAFVTLLVTVDPIGLAPIFMALTTGMSRASRIQVAFRGVIIGACILIVFALVGMAVLDLLGITMPAFRIAGGLLLFWLAFEMVYGKRIERKQESTDRSVSLDEIKHMAVFPLAIPLIAGPGAISATVLLASETTSILQHAALIGVIVSIMLLCMLTFTLADRVDRFLGETGKMVLTRLLGVLLAALSVQFVADGIIAFAA
ncbi:MAG: MarC family transcriptional regulator [Hyphomicrobiales bacterium]|nr:MarC family protein [Hyphomicrobiales bacterium]PCJ90923.1 MAG: MarC family transcriptional regulator [Hyphomicrobiales bacterium]